MASLIAAQAFASPLGNSIMTRLIRRRG